MRWMMTAVLANALVATMALAQLPADSAKAAVLATLKRGETIRAALLRTRWVGQFERVGGDTLFFGSAGQPPMGLRFSAVDSVWRRRTAAVPGAWTGTWVGLALGGALMARRADNMPTLLAGAVGGALVGAVMGGVIGSGSRRWQRVYP